MQKIKHSQLVLYQLQSNNKLSKSYEKILKLSTLWSNNRWMRIFCRAINHITSAGNYKSPAEILKTAENFKIKKSITSHQLKVIVWSKKKISNIQFTFILKLCKFSQSNKYNLDQFTFPLKICQFSLRQAFVFQQRLTTTP